MSPEKRKRKTGKKRKGLRLLAGVLIGVPALILLLFFIIALLPSRKTGAWLSTQLSAATGMTVRLEEAAVNPFGSIRIQGVTMLSATGDTLAAVNRARIAYRFLPLFSRTVAVRRIEIDRPVIHLPFPVDTVAEKQGQDSAGVRKSSDSEPLPLALGLWSFDLRNFGVSMVLSGDGPVQKAAVSGIGLEVENAYLPRGTLSPGSPSHGRIRLFSERGSLTLTDATGSYRRSLHLDLLLAKDADGGWQTNLDAGLGTAAQPEIVRLILAAQGHLPSGTATMERCALLLNGTELLLMRGNGTIGESPARVEMDLSGEPVSIRRTMHDLLALLPPSFAELPLLNLPDVTLRLLPGTIAGTTDSLVITAALGADLPVFSPGPGLSIESMRVRISGAAVAVGGLLHTATVSADANLERAIMILPDSSRLAAGPLRLTAEAGIDSSLLPVNGRVDAAVDSLLKGALGLTLCWNIPNARLYDVRLTADLGADSLDIGTIPSIPETLSGTLNAALRLRTAGTDSIDAELTLNTDRIDYVLTDRAEYTGPLTVNTVIRAAALDTLFQRWRIDTLTADLNRIAVLGAAGSWDGTTHIVDIPRWCLGIDNSLIMTTLPAGIRETVPYLTLSGRETIEGYVRLRGKDLETGGQLVTEAVALKDADTGISAEEITATVAWEGSADSLGGSFSLGVHRIDLPGYLDGLLDTVRIGTGFSFSGNAVAVEGGTIEVPAFGIIGGFRALIDSARGARQLSAEGGIRFRSGAPVRFPGGLTGSGDLALRFGCLSLDSLGGRLQLFGDIDAGTLDLRLDTLMTLEGIETRLPFRAVTDMQEGRMLTDATYRPIDWDSYDQRRPLFRELMPEIGHVSIASAMIAGQRLRSAELDIKIDNGWLEVPRFYLHTLSGNVGGKLRVNFGVTPPAPLFYEIEAQAARINAASFVEDSRAADEATELNAVMQFTGHGLDPAAGIDLEGFFNITKIGPRFASTLLQGLDPRGKDRTIRLTRRLLNTGWKPSLFSFEARHGYVYPSLSLVQPWFSPIRLPETMEFGRLPLEFFLKPGPEQK